MGKMVRFSILLLSLIYCMQAGLAQELPLEGKQWLEEQGLDQAGKPTAEDFRSFLGPLWISRDI
jgi:hypothetical protein